MSKEEIEATVIELWRQGIVEPVGVDEHGDILWGLTEKGNEVNNGR